MSARAGVGTCPIRKAKRDVPLAGARHSTTTPPPPARPGDTRLVSPASAARRPLAGLSTSAYTSATIGDAPARERRARAAFVCAAYAPLIMPATSSSEPSRELSSSLVLDLPEIDAHALSLAGGKAANLGELLRAGLPVPPGVCILTDAYRRVAAGAGLTAVLDRLAATPAADTTTLAALAGEARAAMLAAPVPDPVAHAVVDGYRRLGPDVPVAVRSSATAEDLPHASFAGQQDTYLNVVGPEAVLQAVRRCWASLWTDRAVAYRASNGIDPRTVALAVVLQRMVDAAVAGVLFTANPVTGRRGQAVIDASPGLGEAVVSGAVNPDHFVVDSATGAILERRLGDKKILIRAQPGGGTEHVERPGAAGDACITDDQVRALAALGDRVEAHYGAPQDTEWAIDAGGRLWLTQARPITTLFPLPASAPPPGDDLRVYFCFSVAQGLYRPITPMGLAGFRVLASAASEVLGFPVADPLAGPTRYVEAGQRLFVDLTGVLRSPAGRRLMPRVLDFMEARSAVVLRRLIVDPRLSLNRSWLSFVRRVAADRRALPDPRHRAARPGPAAGLPRLRPADRGRSREAPGRARGRDRHRAAPLGRAGPPPRVHLAGSADHAGTGRRPGDARRRRQAAGRRRPERRPADGAARAAGQRHDRDGPRAVGSRLPHPRRSERRRRLARAVARPARRAVPGRHVAGGRPERSERIPAPLRAPGRGGDRHRPSALGGRSPAHLRRARQLSPARGSEPGAGRAVRPSARRRRTR